LQKKLQFAKLHKTLILVASCFPSDTSARKVLNAGGAKKYIYLILLSNIFILCILWGDHLPQLIGRSLMIEFIFPEKLIIPCFES
jgi:hypothetical protein